MCVCKMISEVLSSNYRRFSALNRLMHLNTLLYLFSLLLASVVQSVCDDAVGLT